MGGEYCAHTERGNGAESLRSHQSLTYSRTFHFLMEPKDPLLCQQASTNALDPRVRRIHSIRLTIHFSTIFSSRSWSSLQLLPFWFTKPNPSCVLNSLPVSSYLTLPLQLYLHSSTSNETRSAVLCIRLFQLSRTRTLSSVPCSSVLQQLYVRDQLSYP